MYIQLMKLTFITKKKNEKFKKNENESLYRQKTYFKRDKNTL